MTSPIEGRLVIPFSLSLQPVERLFILDLMGHPSVASVELQRVSAPRIGSGLRFLCFRHDGLVDVLTQESVDLPVSAPINRGHGVIAAVPFTRDRFDTHDGLDLDVELRDPEGAVWSLRVSAEAPPAGHGPFLAPVGSTVARPDRLFAVEMLDFDMLHAGRSRVTIQHDGRAFAVARLPRVLTIRPTLLARWAPEVVAADLMAGAHPPVTTLEASGPGRHETPCGTVEVNAEQRATCITAGEGPRQAALLFPSGLASLDLLPQGTAPEEVPWVFEVAGDKVASGRLAMDRTADTIQLRLLPEAGWTPSHPRPLVRTITTLKPFMRRWPSTYRWDAELSLCGEPALLSARWSRTSPDSPAAPAAA
ncbi:MAG: hypothetical protein WCF04_11125 [Candidatus Nanopelagicales bacterium]